MTEDLRALLRAELGAELPPPIGDIVGAAIRDGRRIRRNHRLRTIGVSFAVVSMLAAAFVLVGDGRVARRSHGGPAAAVSLRAGAAAVPPQSVPNGSAAPTSPRGPRTLTIHSGTARAEGTQQKATPAAMLHLLTQLLPAGRTSHYGVAADDDLHVQLYLDDGDGPAMVRVALGKDTASGDAPARGGAATVTITHEPGDCVRDTVVGAEWPDGTLVRVDVASCLAWDGRQNRPARPALTTDQAIRVATDPRWGLTMDDQLVSRAAARFPILPVFG